MKNLDKLRKKIDIIDDNLLKLLQSRSKLAAEIGYLKAKNSNNSNLFRPERQIKILNRLILKKNKFFSEKDILKFWREIFLHQTNLQGGIDFFITKILSEVEKKIIFESFGSNIILKTNNSLKEAFLKVKKNNNKLLILPYPGKTKKNGWWNNKNFEGLYIISAIPFIYKINSNPKLVVISKNKPILEGDNVFLYSADNLLKNKSIKKVTQLNKVHLYKAKNFVNKNKLKFLGAYPNLKIQ